MSKKIFCKQKSIARVKPGGGGDDDPPPKKKILVGLTLVDEGLMTPPQKIVGLKLCWVVVSIV